MTKILITGGLGYVGGRVAAYLNQTGKYEDIWLSTRTRSTELPAWSKGFQVIELDLHDKESLLRQLNAIRPDYVVHLAAMNEVESMRCPERAVATNVLGTYNLLTQSALMRIEGFIYFSTFHVYGASPDLSITESTAAHPFHPYAITHLAAEGLVRFFGRYHRLKGLVLRLSNAYGCPMHREVDRWMLVANELCRQAAVNGRIILRSSGKQYRDFVPLYDVARAVEHCISIGPGKWDDRPYNLGGKCTMSVMELARRVAKAYAKRYSTDPCPILVGSEGETLDWENPFDYRIDKLEATGFFLEGDMEKELIQTINLCEGFSDV